MNPHPVSVTRNSSPEGARIAISHVNNHEYTATITVNGIAYRVILDTGSSDTWIDPFSQNVTEPTGLVHLGVNSTTEYVDGSISTGPIILANVTFGPYTVHNQAITLAYNSSDHPTLYNGLIGLGGVYNSDIYPLLENTSYQENATPIMHNVGTHILFEHEPDLFNFTTLLMSRSEFGVTDGGVVTISEVLPNMSGILDAPKIDSVTEGKWTVAMDGVYVNGEFLDGDSDFAEVYRSTGMLVPAGNTIATFDTGTSYIRAPPLYAHRIYKDLPGAELLAEDDVPPGRGLVIYEVPCDTKINITWTFGGTLFPMHPVDAIDIIELPQDDSNAPSPGYIGPHAFVFADQRYPSTDWLLGASFLRNAYQLYHYGSEDMSGARPYIQLLSTTDEGNAWAEADALNSARVRAFEAMHSNAAPLLPSLEPLVTGESSAAVAEDRLGAPSDHENGWQPQRDLSVLKLASYFLLGYATGGIYIVTTALALLLRLIRR
ncbi:aspartic peptidase domain-containing protein [Trametes polyzona]|nr:aspartic peptidase domain-containing protein [Trametes polyzona]